MGLVVACSSAPEVPGEPEGPEEKEEVAIGFSANFTEVGSAVGGRRAASVGGRAAGDTRAVGDGELTNAMLKEQGFGVYCWYTGSTPVVFSSIPESKDGKCTTPTEHISTYVGTDGYMLMRNQKVEWKKWDGTTDTWNYTPSKYWPLVRTEMLTFRAYAPYTNYLLTDNKGMPQLPVVVAPDDYHNGTQHDPLWGTGALIGTHITHTPSTNYMPDNCVYGDLYNNITYAMSGDYRSDPVEGDPHNGTIHWFFHHGMSKIIFTVAIKQDPGCEKVVIRGISITPLYNQGKLDISSPTADNTEKPYWTECGNNMTVELKEEKLPDHTPSDFAASPYDDPSNPGSFVIQANTVLTEPTAYYPLLDDDPLLDDKKGLLIIPREYTTLEKMTITIYYSIDDETEVLEAKTTLPKEGTLTPQNFYGNTAYTLNMLLEPATRGLEITLVQSAFTTWIAGGEGEHEVYNW